MIYMQQGIYLNVRRGWGADMDAFSVNIYFSVCNNLVCAMLASLSIELGKHTFEDNQN